MYERAKVAAKKSKRKEFKTAQTQKNRFNNHSSPLDQILFLQRTIGNQAVESLFKSGIIQAKLKIGKPNDIYEQEADRVAEQIVSSYWSVVNNQMKEGGIQRQTEEEERKREEEETLQLKKMQGNISEVTPDIESRIRALRGSGQPLPKSIRAFFESRFGYDFSHVRIHNDPEAAKLARALNAEAFTYGRDIYFGEGRYNPNTLAGKRLLAHELTHVVQQGNKEISLLQRQITSAEAETEESRIPMPLEETKKVSERRGILIKEEKVKKAIKYMKNDVNQIIEILKEWVIDTDDENKILSYIKKWNNLDEQINKQYGISDTSFLDTFISQMKMHSFWKGTARTAWVKFYTSVFDDLFRELEDDRLDEFKKLLSKSKRYSSSQPKPLPPSFYEEVVIKTLRQYPAAATGFIAGAAEKAGFVPFIGPWIKKEFAPVCLEYAREVAEFYGVEESEIKEVIERGREVGHIEMSFIRGYYALYVLLGNVINIGVWGAKNPEKVKILYLSLKKVYNGLSYLNEKYPEFFDYLVEKAKDETVKQLIKGVKNLSLEAWAEILGATTRFGIKLLIKKIKVLKNTIAFVILQLIRFIRLASFQRIEDLKEDLRKLGKTLQGKDVNKLIEKLRELEGNLPIIEKGLRELEEEI